MLGDASAAMTLDVYSGLFDDRDGVTELRESAGNVYGSCNEQVIALRRAGDAR